MEKTVILSAGHSLTDPGAICPWDKNITETKIVMQITRYAAEILRVHSVGVLEVPDDIDLQGTINWINTRPNTIDLAVEIHVNSASAPEARGVEGWHYTKDEASKKLAQWTTDAVMAESGMPNRGTIDETRNRWGILGFIHYTKPLAALIECGFITNKQDVEILTSQEGQYNVAKGVARGILGYMGLDWKPELLEPQKKETYTPLSSQEALQKLQEEKNRVQNDLVKEKLRVQNALRDMREYKTAVETLSAAIDQTIKDLTS